MGAALYAALTDEFKPTTDQCRPVAKMGLGKQSPEMEHAQQAAFELVRND